MTSQNWKEIPWNLERPNLIIVPKILGLPSYRWRAWGPGVRDWVATRVLLGDTEKRRGQWDNGQGSLLEKVAQYILFNPCGYRPRAHRKKRGRKNLVTQVLNAVLRAQEE
jgi:hypothetical protein